MALLSTVYCTIAELQRYMSAAGVIDWADHDSSGQSDTDVVEDQINEATMTIDLYLRERYTKAVLAAHTLVNRWCVRMSAYYLCSLRGNPPPDTVAVEFEWIAGPDGYLPKIKRGDMSLPDAAQSDDLRPTMSNVSIDRRYRHSKVRVSRPNSSDAPTKLTQDLAFEPPAYLD